MDGPWKRSTSGDERYLYNGKEVVDNGSLRWHDYGARYYDPVVGRFGQVDPLAAEIYGSFSPYNYVLNNPINALDPFGSFELTGEAAQQWVANRQVRDGHWTGGGDGGGDGSSSSDNNSDVQLTVTDENSNGGVRISRGNQANAPYIYTHDNGLHVSGDATTITSSIVKSRIENVNQLVNRFMIHWKLGGGSTYVLTESEFDGLISSYSTYNQLNELARGMKDGDSKDVSFVIGIRSNQSATVGKADIVHNGNLTMHKGNWYFTGTGRLNDTYNFNLGDRPIGEWFATLAGKIANNAGSSFKVQGPMFPVIVSSTQPFVFKTPRNDSGIKRIP
jgi:RHS repeat-associated protein